MILTNIRFIVGLAGLESAETILALIADIMNDTSDLPRDLTDKYNDTRKKIDDLHLTICDGNLELLNPGALSSYVSSLISPYVVEEPVL